MTITKHLDFWPRHLPTWLEVPHTSLYHNLQVSAMRYPTRTAIFYYGTKVSYETLLLQVDRLAAYLHIECHVNQGDSVLLYMQNSPQYVISFYAIVSLGAVVIPINPMSVTEDLMFYEQDSKAKIAIIGQELYANVAPLISSDLLSQVIVATYSDFIDFQDEFEMPKVVTTLSHIPASPTVILWKEALANSLDILPIAVLPSDIAVLPYTSGTTGKPKGCIHTHETVQTNAVGGALWSYMTSSSVILATLPLFHVTGMEHSMNAPIYVGATMVIMTRWNRDTAAQLIEKTGCTHWTNIATMVVDFLSNPKLSMYNISTLKGIGGGGATLPAAVGNQLLALTGVAYAEGYGLSETMSQTHFNPPDRPKMQCMGIPSFNVDARIIDPMTLEELGPNAEGEIIVHGPQICKGYFHRPEETQKAFIEFEGKTFFRTGDIGKYDEEGYFFMVDRMKRMINAAGFKVWPSEVESLLYRHPAILQACVIGVPDPRRGETVKAYIIPKKEYRDTVTELEVMEWSKEHMAAYKIPRIVEFVEKLPTSATGKVLWRELQEQEKNK
ncbi:long-chain fatty acid--CoA ligase [Sulfoacidibacillus ferrooxidans]|uniref:Long-chain-fatty-acid--CoA ligase n=1 Tax=Sulfoacidibacillus ferrooxidans TaxID=2005001 RepID=A0A9X1VAB6_9BACL|nr:long-chain fatty acid--CoA ligase [Sulfoacidibacillus ferrooxidans]MCI0182317.1 Long-chain-fatty-acid--CoA ligase [Sulfoacidibacillus ferrooxidans]